MSLEPIETWVVTGGAGYIGAHVVADIRRAGHRVVVIDDLSTGRRERLPPDVRLLRAALADVPAVRSLLEEERPSGVIHLAAKKSPTESVARPLHYAAENVAGLIALLTAMESAAIERLVFSSSCSVYGDVDTRVVDEETPLRPVSPYGDSKAYGERLLMALAAAGGPRTIALRYFNVVGAASPVLRDDSRVNLLPNVLAAAEQHTGVNVFGGDYETADGTCVRDYVDVRDLAGAHRVAAAATADEEPFRAYNVGTGNGVSVLQLIDAVAQITGVDVPAVMQQRRPGDPAHVVASVERISKELGWRAIHDLGSTIGSAWSALHGRA